MENDRLWAPWRLAYIKGEEPSKPAADLNLPPGADPDCFICRALAAADDRENLVVLRTGSTVTLLNRFPYNNGHLLVAPRLHKPGLEDLDGSEQLGLMDVVTRMSSLLKQLLQAQGFNIGLNLGLAGGAGLPGHLHWHIVPRWSGDTNFMASVAGARVIPQSLDELWQILSAELADSAKKV